MDAYQAEAHNGLMRMSMWIGALVAVLTGCSDQGHPPSGTGSHTGTDTRSASATSSGATTATETRAGTTVPPTGTITAVSTDTGTAASTGTNTAASTGTGTTASTGTGTAASGDGADYVNAHNAVRSAVVKPDNYPAGQTWEPLPTVSWSSSIAATAQAWVDHLVASNCAFEHDTNSGYGENLAEGTNLTAQGAVDMWAREKSAYTYNPRYQFSSATGHYTQLVWRKSTQIGCASATCNRMVIICCRYSPAGNYLGQQPY